MAVYYQVSFRNQCIDFFARSNEMWEDVNIGLRVYLAYQSSR